EAEWKHTEGSLRRLIAAKEEELATRHTELRNRLTAMQSERDRTLHQYALVQTRQDTSPTPAPRAGAVVTPVASVASEQVRVATYEVKPGDDLGTIYKKHFGGPIKWPLVKKIAEKNGLASPNDIHPGQILNLAMIEVE
ncbi:MAG: LysM peptidoglycan-binding domain-containing protein, partial [Planctomycetes bacterium]|nr:LysM peptidoglycan-binding domain-containing protein [Planctomycetota bacterium]